MAIANQQPQDFVLPAFSSLFAIVLMVPHSQRTTLVLLNQPLPQCSGSPGPRTVRRFMTVPTGITLRGLAIGFRSFSERACRQVRQQLTAGREDTTDESGALTIRRPGRLDEPFPGRQGSDCADWRARECRCQAPPWAPGLRSAACRPRPCSARRTRPTSRPSP